MLVGKWKSAVVCLLTAAIYTCADQVRAETALIAAGKQPLARVGANPAPPAAPAGRPAATDGAYNASDVGEETDARSRAVARRVLFAGIAAAAVIAILSGAFALRHKRQPELGSNA